MFKNRQKCPLFNSGYLNRADDWMAFGNSLYYYSHYTLSYSDAVQECEDLGAILAELHTKEEDDEIQIIPRIEFCRSSHMTIFVGCTYAYKGLLMVSKEGLLLCAVLIKFALKGVGRRGNS